MVIGLLLISTVALQQPNTINETARELINQIVTMSKDDVMGDLWMRRPFMLVAGEEDDPHYKHPLYKDGASLLIPHPSTKVNTPIRKLVAMGTRALPALLKQIDDGPLLQATMQPLGVGAVFGGHEKMTLGEVCSVIIGEIVNRYYPLAEFDAWEQEFYDSISIDGLIPRNAEELWEAHKWKTIRDEWTGLTKKAHIASLKKDLLYGSNNGREQGAIVRLAYYAPKEVTALAIARLSHPVEFITEYYTDYRRNHRGTARSPNFILPLEFADVLGAMLSIEDPDLDRFCADWLAENFDKVTTDPAVEYDVKFDGMSRLSTACMYRLLMHTRKYDGQLHRYGRQLLGSKYEWLREEGELVLLAVDHPERFTWSHRKWFDCSDTHHGG